MLGRRDALILVLAPIGCALVSAAIATGCARGRDGADRCGFCGMKIDPTSAWRADLVKPDGAVAHFDTPRCALLAWRTGKQPARAVRVQEYYDRSWRDGAAVRFAVGSDVIGPMGPDVVPVDPARAEKLSTDHHAARTLTLDEVTTAVLQAL